MHVMCIHSIGFVGWNKGSPAGAVLSRNVCVHLPVRLLHPGLAPGETELCVNFNRDSYLRSTLWNTAWCESRPLCHLNDTDKNITYRYNLMDLSSLKTRIKQMLTSLAVTAAF